MLAKDSFGHLIKKTAVPGHHGGRNNSFLTLALFLVVVTFWWVQLLKFLHQRHILPSVLVICVRDTAVGRLEEWHTEGLHTDDPDNM